MSEAALSQLAPDWKYQDGNAYVCPYLDSPDNKIFPEEFLAILYAKCKKDDIISWLFPGMSDITLSKFISLLHSRVLIIAMMHDPENPKEEEIAGFGWLWEVEGDGRVKKATFGFAFFRKHWGTKNIRKLARLAVRWWFDEVKVSVLFGATRADNWPARKLATDIGFNSVGDIPNWFVQDGVLCTAHLYTLTREEFSELEEIGDGSKQKSQTTAI